MRNSLIDYQTILNTTIHHLASIHGGGEKEAQRREDQEAASISSVSSLFIVNSEGVISVQLSYQWEVSTVKKSVQILFRR